MYCSHCGAQIPEDAAFCPSCGQKPGQAGQPAAQTTPPPQARYQVSQGSPQVEYVSATPKYVETIKSEAEFQQEYRTLHHFWYWAVVLALLAIGEVVLVIVVLCNLDEIHRMPVGDVWAVVIGLVITLAILSFGESSCAKRMKNIDSEARYGYYRYIKDIERKSGKELYGNIFQDDRQGKYSASSKKWLCPNCGRVNADYVGTCACGKRRN